MVDPNKRYLSGSVWDGEKYVDALIEISEEQYFTLMNDTLKHLSIAKAVDK